MHLAHGDVKVSNKWLSCNIMVEEMVPIVLSCAGRGYELAKQSVCMQCDNFSVVAAIKKGLPEITQLCTSTGAFGFL